MILGLCAEELLLHRKKLWNLKRTFVSGEPLFSAPFPRYPRPLESLRTFRAPELDPRLPEPNLRLPELDVRVPELVAQPPEPNALSPDVHLRLPLAPPYLSTPHGSVPAITRAITAPRDVLLRVSDGITGSIWTCCILASPSSEDPQTGFSLDPHPAR